MRAGQRGAEAELRDIVSKAASARCRGTVTDTGDREEQCSAWPTHKGSELASKLSTTCWPSHGHRVLAGEFSSWSLSQSSDASRLSALAPASDSADLGKQQYMARRTAIRAKEPRSPVHAGLYHAVTGERGAKRSSSSRARQCRARDELLLLLAARESRVLEDVLASNP